MKPKLFRSKNIVHAWKNYAISIAARSNGISKVCAADLRVSIGNICKLCYEIHHEVQFNFVDRANTHTHTPPYTNLYNMHTVYVYDICSSWKRSNPIHNWIYSILGFGRTNSQRTTSPYRRLVISIAAILLHRGKIEVN